MGTPKDHINCGCGRLYDQHNLEELKSYEGTEPARRAVLGIIDNLVDRRGIKEALNEVGRDVREEMIETLTQIVATSYRQNDRRNRDRV